MLATKRLFTILLSVVLCVPAALAQIQQRDVQPNQSISQEVMIIIQQEQVRFTAQKAVLEMRLEVFDQTGDLVYDSGLQNQPELNWSLKNGGDKAIKSGMYAYRLSIREAGADTPRVRKGHFIVDRASEQDGKTDRLWITSQNASVGTELTVASDESSTIAGTSTSSSRTSQGREGSKRDVNGRETEPAEQGKNTDSPSATSEAVLGTAGQIAKFTSATDVGNSVMTEQGGNIGVGTASPTSKLDVRGHFTLDAGGSPVLFTAASGGEQNRFLQLINSPAYASASGLKAGGVLVADSYNFANPGKNDLVVKGNVGFGTGSLSASRVTIEGQNALTAKGYEPFLNLQDTNDWYFQSGHRIQSAHGDLNFFQGSFQTGGGGIYSTRQYVYVPRLVIKDTGNVGIGTSTPNHQLSLGRGPTWTRNGWGGAMELENASAIAWKANSAGNRFGIGQTNTGLYFFRTASDPGTTGSPAVYDMIISDSGVVSVRTLQITGGADFAENFDVNVSDTEGEAEAVAVEPGMVVSIDPTSPGRLALTSQAYDRRVAGIISGAGGVKPGMMMSQEGTLAHGKHPVALSGRVYCWVDASSGAIEPGDLLTTSATRGHAMKVADPTKAQGAIIGKAMTGLKEGKGLVLVLVTLQ